SRGSFFSCLPPLLALSDSGRTVIAMPRVPPNSPARRAANLPFGLWSTASSRRSRFETKPRASCSSRSSRSFSALLSATRPRPLSALPRGPRRKAQRGIGGRTHGQSDRGDDPLGRAACVHAASECEGLAPGQSAELAADERASKFSEARNRDQPEGHEQEGRV